MTNSKNSKENKNKQNRNKQNLIRESLTKILKKNSKRNKRVIGKTNNKKNNTTNSRNNKANKGKGKKFVQKGGNYPDTYTQKMMVGGVDNDSCPSGQVCISNTVKNIIIFIIFIVSSVLLWVYISGKNKFSTLFISNPSSQPQVHVSPGVIINPSLSGNGITLSELETIGENGMVETHPRQVYRHAQRRLSDPLLAPERSNPRMSPFSIDVSQVGIPINEPTRGESGPYQQVGYLQAEGEKILPLFGRQVYPGSNKWTYYTSTDQYHQVKVPIKINNKDCTGEYGCDEIYDDSRVDVPAYPNRDFKATIYSLDAPRYIPFV